MADTVLRPLAGLAFSPPATTRPPAGAPPELRWLPLSALRIDPRYQRGIARRGEANIRRILENFDWALFTPVICVYIGKKRYAIIDGQHRAVAVHMHPAIREVPCQIVKGDVAGQARAFVAINNQVTRLTSFQIHLASVAAGDKTAHDIDSCCRAAGAAIAPYPKQRETLAKGETLALGAVRDAIAKYGMYRTGLALKALVDQDEAGGGLVNRDTLKGLVASIATLGTPPPEKQPFLDRIAKIDIRRIEDAAALAALTEGGKVAARIADLIVEKLTSLGYACTSEAAAKDAPTRAARPAPRRGRGSY